MIPRHRPEFTPRDLLRALLSDGPDLAPPLAAQLGRRRAWWVPSGRSGLAAALTAVGARAAIVPAFNCWAVMQSLDRARVRPDFVDVAEDLNPSAEQTLQRIAAAADGTVLVLTHQFGVPMPHTRELLDAAARRGIAVVEDAAAAMGAATDAGPVGSLGDVSVLSFQYTKSVFAGDGGLVLTSGGAEDALTRETRGFTRRSRVASMQDWLKLLALSTLTHPRLYGWTLYRALPPEGTRNERDAPVPETMFSALPSTWMRRLAASTWSRLEATLATRRRIARTYLDGLTDLPARVIPETAASEAAPIRFPLLIDHRAAFVDRCAREGLDLGRSFAYTCSDAGFPHAERVARTIVNLPLSGRLERRVPEVLTIVRRALAA